MNLLSRTFALALVCEALALGLGASVASAAPLKIYAAGSLTGVMKALIEASGLPPSAVAEPVYGPAGLLRERLTKGETADLFFSADLTQPVRLAEAAPDHGDLVVPFARNRMCLAARSSLGFTASNMLERLLDPVVRLATSTPGADPGGDYAVAVFERAEKLHSGAATLLNAKAQHLLGAPNTMTPVDGHSPAASIFLKQAADALIYYCSSSASLLREVDGLVSIPLPETLEVHPIYAMLVRDTPESTRFALFVVSRQGQAILARFGLQPLTVDTQTVE